MEEFKKISFNELKNIDWDSIWLKEIYPERFNVKKNSKCWEKELNK